MADKNSGILLVWVLLCISHNIIMEISWDLIGALLFLPIIHVMGPGKHSRGTGDIVTVVDADLAFRDYLLVQMSFFPCSLQPHLWECACESYKSVDRTEKHWQNRA